MMKLEQTFWDPKNYTLPIQNSTFAPYLGSLGNTLNRDNPVCYQASQGAKVWFLTRVTRLGDFLLIGLLSEDHCDF